MSYAIARLKKLKRSNIASSASHTARERETPNADPDQKNIRFIGSLDSSVRLQDLVDAKIAEHKQKRKIRTDGVYCVEFLLSASPSYFRPDCPTMAGYYEPQKLDDWLEATHQWLADFYGDRIVRAELHLDEATPHIHAYFVPLDDEGQLRCNHFFDGRQKIQKFQDSYYETMRLLGLTRGIRGSKAQHQDIKDFYRIVESGRDLEVDDLNAQQLKAKAADRDRATRRFEEMEATAKALDQENQLLQKRISQLEQDNHKLRQQTNQLRDLPLEDVAWELGLSHEERGWVGRNHIINIDGENFTDLDPGSPLGGNGAIDLVKHVNECNEYVALALLRDRFGELGAQRAVIAQALDKASQIISSVPALKFSPPAADKTNWPYVERYLTHFWGIPLPWVEVMHNRGLVYADARTNAVFLMRNFDGEPQGAFVHGTKNNLFKGYEFGTLRRDSWFYFHLGGQPTSPVEKVVLSGSPIDAISCAMLECQVRGDVPPTRTLYMAVDDPKSLPVERLQNIPHILLTFGNDKTDLATARALMELLPQSKRLKCKANDWNAELINFSRQLQQHHYSQQNHELEL